MVHNSPRDPVAVGEEDLQGQTVEHEAGEQASNTGLVFETNTVGEFDTVGDGAEDMLVLPVGHWAGELAIHERGGGGTRFVAGNPVNRKRPHPHIEINSTFGERSQLVFAHLDDDGRRGELAEGIRLSVEIPQLLDSAGHD